MFRRPKKPTLSTKQRWSIAAVSAVVVPAIVGAIAAWFTDEDDESAKIRRDSPIVLEILAAESERSAQDQTMPPQSATLTQVTDCPVCTSPSPERPRRRWWKLWR